MSLQGGADRLARPPDRGAGPPLAAPHRKIDDRLELLDGYLIAYLNLDRVIQIIREEDEPKPVMMAEFGLTDRQAEAILNMRLRSLAQAGGDADPRRARRARKGARRAPEADRLARPAAHPAQEGPGRAAARYGRGDRARPPPHLIEEAGPAREIPLEAMIEREPITVIMSQRGWIRAMKGHVDLANPEAMKFKEGDGPRFFFHAQTTDKLLLAAANGRFYTLAADKLPGGRGFGEPVRLMVDIEGEGNIVALMPAQRRRQAAARHSDGRGFITSARGAIAETRKGKQVVNLRARRRLKIVRPIGEERRLSRRDRRQPEDGRLPADRASGNGPRPGRAAPALPRRRPFRRVTFRFAEGSAGAWAARAAAPAPRPISPLAHRPRRRRPDAAGRLPAGQRSTFPATAAKPRRRPG
jgi:DNA gyrase/topoisomerase IV subunit A